MTSTARRRWHIPSATAGGRLVESPDEVGDLMMIVNMIRAAALPRRESAGLILKIRS